MTESNGLRLGRAGRSHRAGPPPGPLNGIVCSVVEEAQAGAVQSIRPCLIETGVVSVADSVPARGHNDHRPHHYRHRPPRHATPSDLLNRCSHVPTRRGKSLVSWEETSRTTLKHRWALYYHREEKYHLYTRDRLQANTQVVKL